MLYNPTELLQSSYVFFLYCKYSLNNMLTCGASLRRGGYKFCRMTNAWSVVYLFAEEFRIFT